MGVRERRRAERQGLVLDTATALIEEQGPDGVTMEEIARRMGASVGGLYRYFPSRQAIFAALQIRSIQAFVAFLDAQICQAPSPLARLRAAFDGWPAFAQAHPHDFRLLHEFLSSPRRVLDDPTAAEVDTHLQACLHRIGGLLDAAVEIGELSPGDSQVRTHLLWAGLHGLSHFAKRDHLHPPPLQVAALRDHLFETLLTAWRATPAATGP